MTYQYIKNPQEIYNQSFKMIDELVDVSAYSINNGTVIKRLIHACGVPDIVNHVHCHPDFAHCALKALNQPNCHVFADSEMVLAGIMKNRAPGHLSFQCTLNHSLTPELAKTLNTTRSAAAVELWKDQLDQAIVVIGNAPTALFHLLEMLDDHPQKPAAIIGLPVGFIGAAESKQALIDAQLDIPFITLTGRMGGSAMASAAVNALLLQLK